MKYMGSKKNMLKNGLGELIIEQSKKANDFIDPFCGSAAVVWFAADNIDNKIIAGDLQQYAVNLANSVIKRSNRSDDKIINNWLVKAKATYQRSPLEFNQTNPFHYVSLSREYCQKSRNGIILKAYGGYYFSPEQARKIDILLSTIPTAEPYYSVASAALIIAATFCVASPGHTAQPFRPTDKAIRFIMEAWQRDPFIYVERALVEISSHQSKKKGTAIVSNAVNLISKASEGDLIFLDPPYSGVHYSRFYHVLETIARNAKVQVSGKGRYPSPSERPKSDFSMKTSSKIAFDLLLQKISEKKASAIITFPANACSNGLNGDTVKELSQKYFKVKKDIIKGTFSTLGGNKIHRPARQNSAELILLLEPK